MTPEPPNLSRSVEDYLKAIWSLTERGEAASTSNIASVLEVQPASVSGMVKRLAESGWVEHLRYRGVTLTDQGNREALRIVRRHRVLETYLPGGSGTRGTTCTTRRSGWSTPPPTTSSTAWQRRSSTPAKIPTGRPFRPGPARSRPGRTPCSPRRHPGRAS
jgi:hypothetical protein